MLLFYNFGIETEQKVYKRQRGREQVQRGNKFRFISRALDKTSSTILAIVVKLPEELFKAEITGWSKDPMVYKDNAIQPPIPQACNQLYSYNREEELFLFIKYNRATIILVSDSFYYPYLRIGALAWVITCIE